MVVPGCLDGGDVEHSGYRDGVRVFVSFSQDRNRLISPISMILDFASSSRAFMASYLALQGDLLACIPIVFFFDRRGALYGNDETQKEGSRGIGRSCWSS